MRRLRLALAPAVTAALIVGAPVGAAARQPGTDASAAGSAVARGYALVQLKGAPLATSSKTKPAPGKKVDFNSKSVKSYKAQLAAQRNEFKAWLRKNAPKARIVQGFDLAFNGRERPVSLAEMGARQEIPARYLEQIFQKLRRAGLVRSKRGPGGGYLLARAPDQISLADVVLAVQGALVTLAEQEAEAADENPVFVWDLIRDGLEQTLGAQSIADLCREAADRGVARARTDPVMYEI